MISFSQRYSDVIQIKLEHNFRCSKEIVDIADESIKNNSIRLPKEMKSFKTQDTQNVIARLFDDTYSQYTYISKEIEYLHSKGIEYEDIAILVRKSKHIQNITSVLDQYNIPYFTDSAEYFFNSLYFEKFILTLNLLCNFDKSELYNIWKGYMNEDKFNEGFKFLRRIVNSGGNGIIISLSSILKDYLEIIEFANPNTSDYQLRIDCLKGVVDILNDFDEIYNDFQISGKIKWLLDFLGRDALEQYKYHNFKNKKAENKAVQILTVHKSKGLEYSTVFIPNMEDGEFPVSKLNGKKYWHVLGSYFENNKSKYESNIEDERKLFYVAITRAKEYLYFTYEFSRKNLSVFISEISSSEYLDIDESDLHREQMTDINTFNKFGINMINLKEDKIKYMENKQLVKEARDALYDYYHTANHYCKGIILEFQDIVKQGDEAIIQKAQELNLI